ncbi:hypothetical protein RB213_004793 [Colletotrichum asianum]
MSIYLSLNEELHNDLNEDVIFTPGDMWQSEDEDNEGEDRGVRGRRSSGRLITPLVTIASKRVLAKDFKSIDALKMMQEKHTINFRLYRWWLALYGVKHFIVMHPVTGEMSELLLSTVDA